MTQGPTPAVTERQSRFRWRRAFCAAVCGAAVCAFFAAKRASGAWSDAYIPIGDVMSLNSAREAQDALISGLVRLHGADFTLYSGAKIQSLNKVLDVNLERGGKVSLCPRSELQVLSSHEKQGVLLAFQAGGAQSPFPVSAHDVVMTPDWRIELKGAADDAGPSSVLLTMSNKGEVCFEGKTVQASYFRVSEMAGYAVFNLQGDSMARFANGTMQRSTTACSCQAGSGDTQISAPLVAANRAAGPSQGPTDPASSSAIAGMQHAETASTYQQAEPVLQHSAKHRQRPQDVVGYVGAFVHFLFGR